MRKTAEFSTLQRLDNIAGAVDLADTSRYPNGIPHGIILRASIPQDYRSISFTLRMFEDLSVRPRSDHNTAIRLGRSSVMSSWFGPAGAETSAIAHDVGDPRRELYTQMLGPTTGALVTLPLESLNARSGNGKELHIARVVPANMDSIEEALGAVVSAVAKKDDVRNAIVSTVSMEMVDVTLPDPSRYFPQLV